MMNYEERYEYVMKRCTKLTAKRGKKRTVAMRIAMPVCGAAAVTGLFAVGWHHLGNGTNIESMVKSNVSFSVWNSDPASAPNSIVSNDPVESVDQSVILNIGEIEVSQGENFHFYMIPLLFGETRDDTLAHFGLSSEFGLSGVVDGLEEVPADPKEVFKPNGMHCFGRSPRYEGDTVGEIWEMYDNDDFRFENSDGTKRASVIFSHGDIPWWRNGLIDRRDVAGLPMSVIAGTEMVIGQRNIGGYYAEFETPEISVGLLTEGCTEQETVAILKYLADFVGVSKETSNDETSASVGSVSVPDFNESIVIL